MTSKENEEMNIKAELLRRWNNFKALPTMLAYRVLRRAMQRDPSYAHSWYCNVWAPIFDLLTKGQPFDHDLANKQAGKTADQIMRTMFNVKNSQYYDGKEPSCTTRG